MKFLTIALVFAFLVFLSGYEAAQLKENTCTSDGECIHAHGKYCFCLKQEDHRYGGYGQCICNMDPNIFNSGCRKDDECKSHAHGFQECFCKVGPGQAAGKCECVDLLLG